MAEFPFKVKALFNYTSPHDDDLNFTGGQVITVTDEEDTEWYYGEYVDQSGARKEGMFPRNFVDRVEPDAPPRPARSHRARKSASGIQPPSAPALGESTTTATDIPPEPVLASHADDDARPPDRVAKAKELPLASGQLQPLPTASTPDMEPIPLPLHRTSSLTKAPPSAAAAAKPGTNTFKDRIAAFNKPAAPPIAPFKPASLSSGSSGFVKKPYVPPPPSRDAYIPPPREPAPSSYRREDDTGTEPFASEGTRLVDAAPELEPDAEDEIQVQPTSLKERIALLQKQQLENAMRHSDTAQRKEHGKKPTRQLTGTPDVFDKEDVGGGAAATGTDAGDRDESSDKIPGHERPSLSSGLKLAEPAIPHQAPIAPSQEVFSDANDADQSGFDEMAEDVEENLTDHNKPDRAAAFPVPMRPAAEPSSPRRQGTQNSEKETRQDEEDQDAGVRDPEMDPEIKRRMELRERMAKMSGGMGMPGMFGMPGAGPRLPAGPAARREKATEPAVPHKTAERLPSDDAKPGLPATTIRAPPVIPAPKSSKGEEAVEAGRSEVKGLSRDRSGVEQAGSAAPVSVPPAHGPEPGLPIQQPGHPGQISPSISRPGTGSSDVNLIPSSPRASVGAPVSVLSSPHTPSEEPTRLRSPSAGSKSDEHLTSHLAAPFGGPVPMTLPDSPLPAEVIVPPVTPSSGHDEDGSRRSIRHSLAAEPHPSTLPSRPRPRPPPPPSDPPRPRTAPGENKSPKHPKSANQVATNDEVTEYDGDYDTDIASGAPPRAALKGPAHDPTITDDSGAENSASNLPVPGRINTMPPIPRLPAAEARRAPAPRAHGQPGMSSEGMPRAAPPPVPTTRQDSEKDDPADYDPYRYVGIIDSSRPAELEASPTESTAEALSLPEPSSSRPLMRGDAPSTLEDALPSQHPPTLLAGPLSGVPARKEPQRTQSSGRRSMEQGRSSFDQGYIAKDVELGKETMWWTERGKLPPVFQGRADILHEMEESRSSKRGGKTTVVKDVYILFQDYSQTVITASYDPSHEEVDLEQRHEPPPPRLRQDQLEEFQAQYGRRIAEEAKLRQNTTVGDGDPHSLVIELIKPLSGVLMPVGSRAYGAMVYLNLANASIQQHDEIKPGDIITFRKARFQGHRGTMHQKYSLEIGKPDHVGIVLDWDGTKKKVRVWEQGRDGKKVKSESFKLGDLRSGEVKVWRIVNRGWVGWDS